MSPVRNRRAVMCALVALALVSTAAVASAATRYAGAASEASRYAGVASEATRYAGRTTQRAPISFTLSGGYVRKLRFTIFIKCPSRHVWRIAASNFPPIKIEHGSFAQKFVARGSKGSATVKGRVSRRRVHGTLADRTYEPREHHFCAGTASFDLAVQPQSPPRRKRTPPHPPHA